ncbi:MAG: hypothetical protein ACLU4N_23045 [Butyricimonas faecihominis]
MQQFVDYFLKNLYTILYLLPNSSCNDKDYLKKTAFRKEKAVLEKAAIKELVEFERFCRDNALWDEMARCYAVDSHVNISWYQGTGRGFAEASSKMKIMLHIKFTTHKHGLMATKLSRS